MGFETIDGVSTLKVDSTVTLAFAVILLLIGYALKNKLKFLEKYCKVTP